MKLPDASVGVSSGVLSIVNDASVGELNPNKIKELRLFGQLNIQPYRNLYVPDD